MGATVDVLAAMDEAAQAIERQGAMYEGAWRLVEARSAVAELIAADREFDAMKTRKIQADNRVICGAREDDDYRRQANAQHAFDRAIARRTAALTRCGVPA